MIAELGLSRSAVSTAYLVGTLTGAAAMPWVGRALDRFGVRRVVVVIGLVFGAALCALAAVSSIAGLTEGFVAIRMAGQGALGLAATTVVALWFERRRGAALGLVSAIGTAAISSAPLLLEAVIAGWGWRRAWLAEGVLVLLVVLPVAWFALRDRPADLGQHPDGAVHDHDSPPPPQWGVTRAVALRTPLFWVVTAGISACGLFGTAVNFHQVSLLTERGLTATAAAANFLPQTAASLVATLAMGLLVDRADSRVLMASSMAALFGALLLGTVIAPGVSAVLFGLLLGAASGGMRTLEAATFPRYFGTLHIGGIRGTVTAVNVGATAFGPLMFAVLHDIAGSYTPALLVSAPLPVLIGVVALFVRPPALRPAEPAPPASDLGATLI
ncbi:cyanate permease [Lentzea atacamensis]|uniref:Cyanate permease n=1 Tax=Lentzea atacamensis TaxID=531938 RepID=A0ABX9E9E3_9PSEU|nr:MFS transporter [Lentzea atacamensis]RAS64799.1 cyanate permease [Lentzea atacamensis]